MQEAKALRRSRVCTGSSEPSLLADEIGTKIACACPHSSTNVLPYIVFVRREGFVETAQILTLLNINSCLAEYFMYYTPP